MVSKAVDLGDAHLRQARSASVLSGSPSAVWSSRQVPLGVDGSQGHGTPARRSNSHRLRAGLSRSRLVSRNERRGDARFRNSCRTDVIRNRLHGVEHEKLVGR